MKYVWIISPIGLDDCYVNPSIDHVKLRVAQAAKVPIDTDFIPFAKIPLQIHDG
jgi:hypothetical protein